MMNLLVVDFETRSQVDIKTHGTDLYCTDPSTDILCLGAGFTADDRRWIWVPLLDGKTPPQDFIETVEKYVADGGLVVARNARFDRSIWAAIGVPDYGLPRIPKNQWYCSAAQCRVNALPSNLEDAAKALKTQHTKNPIGDRLIRELSIPRKDGTFNEDPVKLRQFGVYCLDDVEADIDVVNSCRLMSPEEHRDWLVNEAINDRGVKVDLELAAAATLCADAEIDELAVELREITGSQVMKPTQYARVKRFLEPLLPEEAKRVATVYKDGKAKRSLDKRIREELLDRHTAGDIELPPAAYNVIAVVHESSMSSVAKFKKMAERADPDTGRVHGAFMYAGAATLRYSSRGLQLHNMRRDAYKPDETEQLKAQLLKGRALEEGAVMDTLSKLLRPALIPDKGKVFVVADWKGIENRCLPWLADSPGAKQKLKLFEAGEDAYVKAAEDARVSHLENSRQIGKVIELSLGYGGGAGAFNSMARNYGVVLPEHEVKRIIAAWRAANAWAVKFWHDLERAAKCAVKAPGETFVAGRVKYTYIKELIDGSLFCELPGGTFLTYPRTRLETVETPFGTERQLTALKANWKPKQGETEWPRFKLWHGVLCENVTQGIAATLLRTALTKLEDVVLHCHDEIALEVPVEEAQARGAALEQVMLHPADWAESIPLEAPYAIMNRYGKPD